MNSNQVAKYRLKLRVWQFGLLAAIFFVWWALTKPGLIPAFVFDNDNQAAFFFGEPLVIFSRIWDWFVVNADIYAHLWTTLVETILAFAFGTVSGGLVGMWLALSPFAAAVADPFIKGLNSMPRVILAPIFAVWFGLGIASKVALGVTLVFFIVFFNVYQGVDLTEECKMTLSEWLDRWLEQMSSMLRPGTLEHYRSDLEHHVKPYLGQKRLTQITADDLRKLYDTLKRRGRVHHRPGQSRGLSTTTVHGIHTTLHHALK